MVPVFAPSNTVQIAVVRRNGQPVLEFRDDEGRPMVAEYTAYDLEPGPDGDVVRFELFPRSG